MKRAKRVTVYDGTIGERSFEPYRGRIKLTRPYTWEPGMASPEGEILNGRDTLMERVELPAGHRGFDGWRVWVFAREHMLESGVDAVAVNEPPTHSNESVTHS